MAIGTTAALALGAATVGSAAIGASASAKASKKASKAATQANAENNALQREQYQQNFSVLSPFVQRGNTAGNAISALLGLPPANDTVQGQPGYAFTGGGYNPLTGQWGGMSFQPAPPPSQPQFDARSAFDMFRNSTGYDFRVKEGMDAIQQGYAARGLLQSGAAQKDLMRFGQGIASDEFGNYLGYLSNQQGVGMSGASALAGVGQNFANSVSANNNATASVIANAALSKAANTNALLGQGLQTAGFVLGSSFK